MARRVLLTGANGFIGSHILTQLLDHGFNVCCAVRTRAKGDQILKDFAAQQSQIAITVVPDIVAPNAYHAAVQGTPSFDTVYHTASPFTYQNVENNLQFLEPAIKGTLNLLKAVKDHAPSVKRVVWTGSCASVVDYDHLVSDPPKLYTEEDWNPIAWEEAVHGDPSKAYRASKLFAEREAWAFVDKEKPHYDLVTICPPATFGPLRHSITSIENLNESNARLWRFCFSSTEDAPMPYMPVHTYVDVRDLAYAQFQAMMVPEAGNQRFAVSARQFSFQEVCDILRSRFPELNHRTPLGKPGTSSLPPGAYSIDNSKVKSLLGVEFRSLEETVVDVARCLLDIERNEKEAHLVTLNLDLLDVSSGSLHNAQKIVGGPCYQAGFSKAVKSAVGDKLLVSAVGSISSGPQAEKLLEAGLDAIFVGRLF
ncbi:dihydroflavonol-4-reductase [Capronia coronata CBS 617.96]|uniref:Dihydroflavonol-4-reductase n=1 Tax=Capronia coronata CBS 617.96 TaxID=1182541 RepID=W9XZK7_9EURO|nr:dihydroflavonol-4-reductase [Capronia coronata CBS 617.96]EXJ85673.1 dihydroflavonol-4-reductase [Capronia coronata CBS 617.96]